MEGLVLDAPGNLYTQNTISKSYEKLSYCCIIDQLIVPHRANKIGKASKLE